MDETFCPRSLKTLSVTNLLRLSRWQKKKVQHRFLRKTKQNHFLINLFSFPEAFSYHVISHNVCGEFKMYLAIIHRIIRMKIKGTDMHLSLSVCGSLCREASVFLKRGPQRIGSTYKKAVYKQYTDATYRVEVTKSDWLGYLGPLLMAEEGDTVVVHLKNAASRPYSIHPHGLNYSKGNEGALYPDGTGPELKRDDSVAPGTWVTYEWTFSEFNSPTSEDSNCLTRFYHSHVAAPKDINTGLIGPLILCKRGTLDVHGDKSGDYLYALLFMVSDENFSWYLDENIRTYVTSPAAKLKEDEDFIESNKMHGINGFLYGNMPGLSMCQGNAIHWHVFALGNEVDMHSVHFHGQILTTENRHTDTISLFPGSSTTAEMVADNPGHWLLTCFALCFHKAGMQAIFEIKKCFPNVHKARPHGEVRQYFIAAEEEVWDYAPTLPTDGEADMFVTRGRDRIGSRYKKVRYVEYVDNTFLTKMLRSPHEQHLGILGKPGLLFSWHNDVGGLFFFEWTVPVGAGPVQGEADCLTYLYYSGVDPTKDTNSGLAGPLLVCRPRSLKKGEQKNYNKEFHLVATVFDENLSWYLDDNIRAFATAPATVDKEDEGFMESNKMHAINGFVYRNLPGLTMCKGDKVTWHLSGLGSETDVNSLYFQGNRFLYRQNRRDSISVFPHISHTVTMEPDSMGQFEVVSPTVNHYRGGMRANYTVQKCSILQRQGETMLHSKTYYIAAMETDWDYAPNRTWEVEMFRGHQSPAPLYLDKQGGFIGSRYKKVVYRQFTNDKFTKQVERAADMEHLGIMGPMIHADVGDKVKVVFKNMASRPYSIHAHGVKTETPDVYDTKPGTHTHTQAVCAICCSCWIPYQTKSLPSSFFLFLFFSYSRYLDENIRTHITNPRANLKDDETFIESNRLHAINGYVYGNVLGLNMEVGDKVYWYLMGMGDDVSMHTAHWHGHNVEYKVNGPHVTDVYELFPATFQTVKMRPQFPGTWLLHCHVTNHIKGGMEAMYTVTEKAKKRGIFG
uniref:ferroxidase n=1 Tax=Scophthalmus maximus TaxID=52904 RepID=A0A8D3DF55_SCOMX